MAAAVPPSPRSPSPGPHQAAPPDLAAGAAHAGRLVARIPDLTLSTDGMVSKMTEEQHRTMLGRFATIKHIFVGDLATTDFEINFTSKTVSWTENGVKQVRDIHENLTAQQAEIVDAELKEMTVFIENNIWKGLGLKIFIKGFASEHKGLKPHEVKIIERHFQSKASTTLKGPPTEETYTRLFADPVYQRLPNDRAKTEVVQRMLRLEKLMMTWKYDNDATETEFDGMIIEKERRLRETREELNASPPPVPARQTELEAQISGLDQEIQKHKKDKEDLVSLNEKLESLDLFALEKALLHYPTGRGVLPADVLNAAKQLANDLKIQVKGTPTPTSRWEHVREGVKSLWYKFHGENEQPEYAHAVAGLLFSGLKPGEMKEYYDQFCREQQAPMQEASIEDALLRWVLLPTPAAVEPPAPAVAAAQPPQQAPESDAFSFARKDAIDRINREMSGVVFAPQERLLDSNTIQAKRRELELVV